MKRRRRVWRNRSPRGRWKTNIRRSKRTVDRRRAFDAFVCPRFLRESEMRYMKVLSLGIVAFASAATMVLGQGNQEAANLTREGIEASKTKDWDKAVTAFRKAA